MKNDEKSVSVKSLKDYFNYEVICGDEEALKRPITVADTNRPGLELTGYFDHTQTKRLVVLGDKEIGYISTMSEEAQRSSFDFLTNPITPAIIITRVHECPPILKQIADSKNFPILRSHNETYRVIIDAITYLDEQLAPTTSLHGVLLSIYGKGVLLTGDSGMGKSEIALELIKRGHRLVSDDVVEIRRVSDVTLVGSAPDITRHFIELRGIGIIDVKTLFGVESVKNTQSIDLVIKLEEWNRDKEYDRLGMEEEYTEFLGNKVVCHSLPIRPGRNLAVIVEAAAVNHRQKKMGYNAAQELYRRVQENMAKKREEGDE